MIAAKTILETKSSDHATCPCCGGSLEPKQRVRLWDARDYCSECVERACAGLTEFARTHRHLEDQPILDWRAIRRSRFEGNVVVSCGLLVGLVELVLGASGRWDLFAWVGGVVLLILGAILGTSKRKWGRLPRFVPKIRVEDGWISIFRSTHMDGKQPILRFPLADCRWRIGDLKQDTQLGHFRGLHGPAVILVAPLGSGTDLDHSSRSSACGVDPKVRARWVGFLRLAKVPEGY
jgi:hypothetical protein